MKGKKERVRLLVVDDHELVRRGLRALLETRPGWSICGEAADGREAVKLAVKLQPEVIVMDLTMPHLNGFESAHQIREQGCTARILILSMHESEQLMREVLAAGVRGYILKSEAGSHLLAGVEALLRGETFFVSPLAVRIHAEEFKNTKSRRSRNGALTRRERETLQLLAEGKTNREVAKALEISIKTAETHRARVMRKLAIDSVAELVRYAIRNGFVAP
jgi:DNA-binding NarL/FixJ family response regulator